MNSLKPNGIALRLCYEQGETAHSRGLHLNDCVYRKTDKRLAWQNGFRAAAQQIPRYAGNVENQQRGQHWLKHIKQQLKTHSHHKNGDNSCLC
ncbi:MAG: hypothetical protein COB35_04950 [Gammaproteobacteria bacterium]|nr:MAG: hypothetical protein COB35_04950 [Gammaproteobacteria bacterium]